MLRQSRVEPTQPATPEKANAMTTRAEPPAIAVFKPVSGGFVCQVPNEWLIGRSRRYLVTEAQKDAIIAQSARPTLIAIFCWTMAMAALGIGAAMALTWVRHSYQFDEATLSDIVILVAATLLSMWLAAKMAFRPVMGRLRPLLASLPKTDIRLTRDDMRQAVEKMSTPKQMRQQAALFSIVVASSLVQLYFQFRHGRSVLSGDPLSILLVVASCMVGAAVILLLLKAQQKAKQERESAPCR
jgi:hypothetical protein